jgi:RNA polymerase sigma-70 factor (ECF subfamily)
VARTAAALVGEVSWVVISWSCRTLNRSVDARVRFEALYRAHGGVVRAFAHRRAEAAAADDVVAEVFVIAWRRLDEAPADELAWLLGIARGVLANHRRGDARRQALRVRLRHERLVMSPAEQGDETHDVPGVLRALSSLSEGDQEVLLLVGWDGLDRARAARILGIGPGVFAVRLHRARRRLARALDREGHTSADQDRSSTMEAAR